MGAARRPGHAFRLAGAAAIRCANIDQVEVAVDGPLVGIPQVRWTLQQGRDAAVVGNDESTVDAIIERCVTHYKHSKRN